MQINDGLPPPPGVYAFAVVGGEPHVRVLFGDGLQVFGAVRSGTHWHRIVGARDDEARALRNVAGGQIEIGDGGLLLRWCVYSYAWPEDGPRGVVVGGDTLKETLSRSRHVPLPLDRLWVACKSDLPEFRDALGSDLSVLQELQASGRLQFVLMSEVIFKASRISESKYARAAECVGYTRHALDAFAQPRQHDLLTRVAIFTFFPTTRGSLQRAGLFSSFGALSFCILVCSGAA